MPISVRQPAEARTAHVAPTQPRLSAERVPAARIALVWRDAWSVFVLRAPAILFVACVCITGPAILSLFLSAILGLDTYALISGPLSTWEGINTLQSGGSVLVGLLCLQAVLGAIGLAFARGTMVCLALNDASEPSGCVAACREARARFPGLLVGSLIYGAFITFGAVGINAMLRDTDFDLNHVGRRDVTAPAKTMALRMLDAFVPSPGSPFAEFVPALRQFSFISRPRRSGENLYWQLVNQAMHGNANVPSENTSTPIEDNHAHRLTISLVSLVTLMFAEVLLRFTPIMAMHACGRTWLGAITPVLHSIGFGIRHFGTVTKHVWLLRLAFVAGYSVFFMLPVVLSQDVLPPVMTSTWKSATGSWPASLTLMCYWLVMALFTAFSTVYDARLYAALTSNASASTVFTTSAAHTLAASSARPV